MSQRNEEPKQPTHKITTGQTEDGLVPSEIASSRPRLPVSSSPRPLASSSSLARLWEVDAIRGVAIVLMIFYHFVWDLNYFGLYQANLLTGPWQWFARGIATFFLFVMGVSLTLSDTRESQRWGQPPPFTKYLWRGGKIFGLGLIITLATYFFIGRGFVIFGILH